MATSAVLYFTQRLKGKPTYVKLEAKLRSDVPQSLESVVGGASPWLATLYGSTAIVALSVVGAGVFRNATGARFQADDFCILGWANTKGFWGTQSYLYTQWTGRFTSSFLQAAVIPTGRTVPFILPMAFFLLLVVVSVAASHFALKWYRHHGDAPLALFVAAIVIVCTLATLPDTDSALYWPTVTIVYAFPLLFLGCLLVFVYGAALKQTTLRAPMFVAFLIAMLGTGLQEIHAALQLLVLGPLLLMTAYGPKRQDSRRLKKLLIAAFVGSIVGLGIDLVAPGNSVRMASATSRVSLLTTVKISARGTAWFAKTFLLTNFSAVVVAGLAGILCSSLIIRSEVSKRALVGWLVGLPVWLGFTLFCMSVPNAYGKGKFPSDYAMFEPYLLVFGVVFGVGVVAGGLFPPATRRLRNLATPIMIPVMCAALIALGVTRFLVPASNASASRERDARLWDAADFNARQQVAQDGQTLAFDYDMAYNRDGLESDPNWWVNVCVASYYGASQAVGPE